ncbi:hypothetical protein F4805DRAFT_413039 [Annulohypoxylon moriforme]|nr:hypothetical protein F4805DRAFT_413039 [Annulohypoxylon moriforme]
MLSRILLFLIRMSFILYEITMALCAIRATAEISSRKLSLSPTTLRYLELLLPRKRILWPLRVYGLWLIIWAYWSIMAPILIIEFLLQDIDETSHNIRPSQQGHRIQVPTNRGCSCRHCRG